MFCSPSVFEPGGLLAVVSHSISSAAGIGAPGAALNVFNSLSTGADVCVISNGALLERQY